MSDTGCNEPKIMPTLAEEWRKYEQQVMDEEDGPELRHAVKLAWYGGAIATLLLLAQNIGANAKDTAAYLISLRSEMRAFMDGLG